MVLKKKKKTITAMILKEIPSVTSKQVHVMKKHVLIV